MSKPGETFDITLRDLRFHARHGVMEQERRVGNEFAVDVTVTVAATEGILRDELEGTVSYADLYEVVRQEMSVPSQLLEHVAYRIGQSIRREFYQVKGVTVSVTKLSPPIAGCRGAATVTYRS